MTTEENFFVRQDVTGFFTMLQGPPGAGWGGDSGPARGGVGIRAPARGVVGIQAPDAGCAGIQARARGGNFLG